VPAIEVKGEHLNYIAQGAGRPLVLLHGIGSCAALWSKTIDAIAGDAAVHAFDLRGHGGSSCNGDLTVAALADDIAAAIDALGIETFDLVGVSLGGAAAVLLAAKFPARVRSLVVSGVGLEPSKALADEIYGVREMVHYLVPDDFALQVSEALLVPDAPAESVAQVARAIGVITKQRYLKSLEALAAASLAGIAPGVKAPTLVLHGAVDEMVSKADADALAGAVAGARRADLTDAGHLANVDDPDGFVAALKTFFADGRA
jgi:pimeloyl-ACP methyl ester carboxylesterase